MAFFKKPDVNSYAYFTYNNVHKVALLGILGAIIGLKGYNQREIFEDKSSDFPEFYERLEKLKVSIVPLSSRGYFSKRIQVFNNSVGYASKETGGNLIVREQWLENPKWDIYILDDKSIESELFNNIADNILNNRCEFMPYLGKNDHIANISNPNIVEIEENKSPSYINSLFPIDEVKLDDELTYDDNNPFLFKEALPIRLNKEYNFYEFEELGFTNLELQNSLNIKYVYRLYDKNLYFI
jgi:CRISPR-associated protein Cas5h